MINFSEEMKQKIDEAARIHNHYPIDDSIYRDGAHFGASLMLDEVLKALRSSEAAMLAVSFKHEPDEITSGYGWADWLSARFRGEGEK